MMISIKLSLLETQTLEKPHSFNLIVNKKYPLYPNLPSVSNIPHKLSSLTTIKKLKYKFGTLQDNKNTKLSRLIITEMLLEQ